MSEAVFNKILIAKYSPTNGCFAAEGEVLSIKPRETLPQKEHLPHNFVSARDLKTKSRYGWVNVVKPFSLADFVKDYLPNSELSTSEMSHIYTMLNSIGKLPEGTPVAATYSSRGVLKKVMQLTVHQVVFYKEG